MSEELEVIVPKLCPLYGLFNASKINKYTQTKAVGGKKPFGTYFELHIREFFFLNSHL